MIPQKILDKFPDARQNGTGLKACCPAHEDSKPSLSIGEGEDGRILLHCFAGCKLENILGAVGLRNSDLFPESSGTKSKPKSVIIADYDYKDEQGELVYQTLRYFPKDFRQRRPDGNGNWIWDLKDTPRFPYRLPELIAADKDAIIYIVEGEKDVDNLDELGLVATCNVGGAKKWRAEYNAYFAGRNVCILPDHDDPGTEHATLVAGQLAGVAGRIKVLELPDLAWHDDVSDWLAHGGTAAELEQLARLAPAWEAKPETQAASATTSYPFNDIGNGMRLVDKCGDVLIYVEKLGWHVWDGKRWRPDCEGLLAGRMARKIAHDLYLQAWHDGDKKLSKWALRSGDRTRVNAALSSAMTDQRVLHFVEELDGNPWLLNCANGTLDLRTGVLSPHCQKDFLTKIIPIDYDPSAPCPLWIEHLKTVFNGDEDVIRLFRAFCGMALSGDVSQERWLFAHGGGDNGKTATLTVIQTMLGEYALTLPSSALLTAHFSAGYELADLRGVRAAFVYELPDGQFNAARIKKLASNEPFAARQIHARPITFNPSHTLFVAGNSKPTVDDTSIGFWRRMSLVPFLHNFSGDARRDEHFAKRLLAELAGILAWSVFGCRMWVSDGLPQATKSDEATADYKTESNPTARFVAEQCIKDASAKIAVGRLYEAYKAWCANEGESPDSNRSFGIQVSQLAPETTVFASGSTRYRRGVKLIAQETPNSDDV